MKLILLWLALAGGSIDSQIVAARQRHPAAFVRVERVLADVATLDAEKRGSLAVIGPRLHALGRQALWPLADEVLTGRAGRGLPPSARLALEVGVIEAAGALRDERLAPLWHDLLDRGEAAPEVLRGAAEALARLDTPEVARELIARAGRKGPVGDAVLATMGNCRRQEVADALAAALATAEGERARVIVSSLALLGSAWAWETPALRQRPDAAAVRATVAQALQRASMSDDVGLQYAVKKALRVVDPDR